VNSDKGTLYLIPVFLDENTPPENVFPPYNVRIVENLRHYIAEHEKNARRFIKKVAPSVPQSELHFSILNKHTPPEQIKDFLQPALEGKDMGLLSDAGMPAIADPGALIVREAHRRGIPVKPLTGPSSVFLALAASGLNGQHFEFHGYLPIENGPFRRKIKAMTGETYQSGKTHVFIETPYRNDKMLQRLIPLLPDDFRLCVAAGLTGPDEKIICRPVTEWKKQKTTFGKVPAVFLFGL